MEDTKQSESKNSEARRNRPRRRRRNGSGYLGSAQKQSGERKGFANGGYTKANQSEKTQERSHGAAGKDSHSKRIGSRDRRSGRERTGGYREHEQRKTNGYQPDTGKDAIRSFDLGTCDDAGKKMVFHFDRGTYSIAERKLIDTVVNEEGITEEKYEDTEVLSTRDKLSAYKAWNEIKRPKKGRNREKKEEEANGSERAGNEK